MTEEESAMKEFRTQIGRAAKIGVFSETFVRFGFQVPTPEGGAAPLESTHLEDLVARWADRDMTDQIKSLTERVPAPGTFETWTQVEIDTLRTELALRIGPARSLSDDERIRALTRTYGRPSRNHLGATEYRDDVPGQRMTRAEKERLYSNIARWITESRKVIEPISVMNKGENDIPDTGNADEDFLIENLDVIYREPSSTDDFLHISRRVQVRAVADGAAEYRFTIETVAKGMSDLEVQLLAGPGYRLECVERLVRNNIPGYAYQVVIPFNETMNASDPPREFSWVTRHRVDASYWEAGRRRIVGVHPTRPILRARVAVQTQRPNAPTHLGVNTGVKREAAFGYHPEGEKVPVVDGYAAIVWTDLRVARYYYLVWPQ